MEKIELNDCRRLLVDDDVTDDGQEWSEVCEWIEEAKVRRTIKDLYDSIHETERRRERDCQRDKATAYRDVRECLLNRFPKEWFEEVKR